MPIDPEIALQGRPAHIAGPMEMYAQLLGLQHQQQQLELQKQSVGALADERRARAQQAQQAVKDTAALDQAYQPGLTREQVIDGVPGHMKAVVAKHFDEADAAGLHAKEARAKADEADTDYAASLAAGVEPWLKAGPEQAMNAAQIALSHAKAQGHDVSTIEQHLQQNPESLPQIIESLIARSPKYSQLRQKETSNGFTLAPGAVRFDAQGNQIAAAAPKPEKPQGKWVPDYDENGNPIDRWVADGPGATAPRIEAPAPRPIVVAPGAKAVDPVTGATVAEGNPVAAAKDAALARVDTVNDAGQNVTRFVQPTAGLELPKPDAAATRPRQVVPLSKEDFAITYAKELGKRPDEMTAAEKEKALQRYARADDKPVAASSDDLDAKAIASAIERGEQPPTLTGLYRHAAAVRAELAKRGYPLAAATTDWMATQKHVATLNSTQQTKLRQSVDNASHSLDVIEQLAKQWDAGGFKLLNKVRLASAKEGALGAKAQTLATQLDSQIADVTSELGNVYMGGNSPTDHALGLAAKNLSADWSRDTLTTMINQARKNLQIRQNSMVNVGVAGASAGNPYAGQPPAQAAPPASGGAPKNGDVKTFPNGKRGRWDGTGWELIQ